MRYADRQTVTYQIVQVGVGEMKTQWELVDLADVEYDKSFLGWEGDERKAQRFLTAYQAWNPSGQFRLRETVSRVLELPVQAVAS